MNGSQFDALTKRLAQPVSRRTTLRALVGVAAGSLTGIFASRTNPALAGGSQPSGPCSSAGSPCCNISSANASFCSASGLICQGRTCAVCGGIGQTCCSDTASYLYEGGSGSCTGDGNTGGAQRGFVTVSKLGNSLVVNITLQRAQPNTTYYVNINCVNGACNQGTIKTDAFGNGRGQIIFPGQGNQPGFFSIGLQTFTGCGSPPPGSDSINSGPLSLGGCTNGTCQQGGTCQPACAGAPCTSNADCTSGSCNQGTHTCAAVAVPGPCRCGGDCTSGFCNGNTCAPVAAGNPCVSGSDCTSQTCQGNICHTQCAGGPCVSGGDCSSGFCNGNTCAPVAAGPSSTCVCGGDCTSKTCQGGHCVAQCAGGPCVSGSDCTTGFCNGTTCGTTGSGGPCRCGGDCQVGHCDDGSHTCVGAG